MLLFGHTYKMEYLPFSLAYLSSHLGDSLVTPDFFFQHIYIIIQINT